MGGPTKSTGSNTSPERKESTKKYFEKKKAAKKSNYKTTKFGFKVKKNIAEQYVDKNPVFNALGPLKDKHNLRRRMRFADKKGIDMKSMSTEQILSKSFKSKLDALGYSKQPGNVGGKNNDGPDNNQTILTETNQNQDMNNKVTKPFETSDTSDTSTSNEVGDENLSAEEIKLRNKRKGKNKNIQTSVVGDTSKATLSEKTLLGGDY